MKTSLSLVIVLGACGQAATESMPVSALQACDAYESCLDLATLTEQEQQWRQWESEASDRCFEFEENPVLCEQQCLVDFADFVRSRPAESGCDPFAVLERHRYTGRAYPKPGAMDASEFPFSLVFVEVGARSLTVEIGEVDGNAPAVLVCPRLAEVGFVCEAVSGPRGATVLQGALRQRDTDLTGDFVLTQGDGDTVEWWFTAGLSD